MERHAKIGDKVKVHFTGTLEDGTVFDTSENKKPLLFNLGSGEVIQGFEEAISGMKVDQEKNIRISSDKAYGPRTHELIVNVEKDKLPKDLEFKLDQHYQIPNEDNNEITVRVSKVSENSVELDGNHPLAGKNLIFKIKLIEILD